MNKKELMELLHETLNDYLVVTTEEGKDYTTKIIRQADLVSISEHLAILLTPKI